jgi:hypothetical protein
MAMIHPLKFQFTAVKVLQSVARNWELFAPTGIARSHDMEAIGSDFARRPSNRICYRLRNPRGNLATSAREGSAKSNAFPIKIFA